MLVGIFALAIGAIVRNTAGGIAAFAGIFFVLPPLMFTLPQSWNNAISQYLPSEAGRQIFALHHAAHTLRPFTGGLVLAAYCAAAIVIAAVLLVRRDVCPPAGGAACHHEGVGTEESRTQRVLTDVAALGSAAASAAARRLTVALGGAERTRVIIVLAAILGLSGADAATVGA